jgi:hypothetical protein
MSSVCCGDNLGGSVVGEAMGGTEVVGEIEVSCGEVAGEGAGDWEGDCVGDCAGEEVEEEAGEEASKGTLFFRRVSYIIWSTLRCFRSSSSCFVTSSTCTKVRRIIDK